MTLPTSIGRLVRRLAFLGVADGDSDAVRAQKVALTLAALSVTALAVIWEPRQLLFLPILYALFALPFFGAATSIGLALVAFPERIGQIYRYDLIGGAAGAIRSA